MASSTLQHHFLLLCSLLVLLIASFSEAATSFRPKALVLPVTKDPSTRQYLTQINQRKPLVPVKLTLDLGGQLLWVDCEQQFFLNSFGPVGCKTAQCNLVIGNICLTTYCNSSKCGNNTCGLLADNTLSKVAQTSILGEDVVSIQSTDGSKPGQVVSVTDFLMTCGGDLQGLPSGVKGMAGLGRTRVSLPSQFSEAFGLARKFAVCLSPSTRANGVVFFGDGPYVLLPNVDVSKSLIYTPLLINPFTTASSYYKREPSSEYFIGVTSIKINNKAVPLNSSLLSITKEGYGGTKISTVHPYTVLETSIYKAVVNAFVKELAHVPRVTSVAPFGACFNSTTISSTRVGPAVPAIDLVLPSTSRTRIVYWRIFGANSMVQVKNDVLCLGFVDGGENPRTSIVIGGHQLEDNLLQFDLASSRLGFSSSLLSRQTTCANFNFTSKA